MANAKHQLWCTEYLHLHDIKQSLEHDYERYTQINLTGNTNTYRAAIFNTQTVLRNLIADLQTNISALGTEAEAQEGSEF